jgi:MoxR-like ATPase
LAVFQPKTGEFNTSLGPAFTNLLWLMRSTASRQVQSALLEVMQEHQVTIGRKTPKVPDPFLFLQPKIPSD